MARASRLGIYPEILGNFEGDGIFLGIYFLEGNLGINFGNYRNCSGKFFAFVSGKLFILTFSNQRVTK